MHRYLDLNRDKKLHIFYLLGVESRERVQKYLRQQHAAAKTHSFGRDHRHRLTIGWIQRGNYGVDISRADLDAMSAQAREQVGYHSAIPSVLIRDPHIDLGVSSTHYRHTHDATLVPGIVDRYVRTHGFYGYSP
jgi:hypothetical protein